jgi:phage shock protein A
MKREKRLEKGVASLEKQVALHKEKLKEATEEGDEDLMSYYVKDIERLEQETRKKRDKLLK